MENHALHIEVQKQKKYIVGLLLPQFTHVLFTHPVRPHVLVHARSMYEGEPCYGLLVLLVVVDLVIPEEGLFGVRHGNFMHVKRQERRMIAYLITVSPEEVLGANVLVRVLGLFRTGNVVGNVLPMGIPPDLCVDASDDDGGDSDTVVIISIISLSKYNSPPCSNASRFQCSPLDSKPSVRRLP